MSIFDKAICFLLSIQTSGGHLLIYGLTVKQDQKRLYEQRDSPIASLKRDSAELFLQETIPALLLNLVSQGSCIPESHIKKKKSENFICLA